MKLVNISFFLALFHSATSNEDAAVSITPKLRINTKTGIVTKNDVVAVEDDMMEKRESKRSTTDDMTSRDRISKYVSEGQMFWILDSTDSLPVNYEDPAVEPTYNNRYIFWLCSPTHAPDANGDGMYDSLVSRVVSKLIPTDQWGAAGATGVHRWGTHGYTGSWSDEAGYYDEYIVDFDDTTVMHIKGKSFNGYETSPAGGRGGFTMVGEGEWTFDTSHPLLQDIAAEIGTDLTAESCAEKYAETWTANNDPPSQE